MKTGGTKEGSRGMSEHLTHVTGPYALVVEDDIDERMVTMLCLQQHSVMVLDAHDGLQALKTLIEADKLDRLPIIIFLDLNMPILTGWDFIEIVSRMRRLSEIPIVITTGMDIPTNGQFRVLKKPYGVEPLVAEIERAKKAILV